MVCEKGSYRALRSITGLGRNIGREKICSREGGEGEGGGGPRRAFFLSSTKLTLIRREIEKEGKNEIFAWALGEGGWVVKKPVGLGGFY